MNETLFKNELKVFSEPFQGSEEWLELRRSKITSTDARVIMGIDPWKTKRQLFEEKKQQKPQDESNYWMNRGLDLEQKARMLFEIYLLVKVYPKVIVTNWQMASVDGISECGTVLVEIKCPGKKDHDLALLGKVPEKYYPQLQHQMHVCGVDEMYYFSYDGYDGVYIKVKRDQPYIDEMIKKEWDFYQCLQENVCPFDEDECVKRDDELWVEYAKQYIDLSSKIKSLSEQQERIKNHLIYLSASKNTQGGGVSLKKVERIGNIDYSKVHELQNVDLEMYRKASTSTWRISLS